ncbi:4a-hydroxytetrahydrobiopterin dehydratase [bacterium]|nr:4a-hydroxytetrahydrobiopterin dehydratase [bacterium]
MTDLADRDCVPCKGGVPPLQGAAIATLRMALGDAWEVVEEHHLEREYRFPDFVTALAFVNRVGEVAEEQNHHPDLELGWGRAKVTIYTHKIDGLTPSDFVFAAKCDRVV